MFLKLAIRVSYLGQLSDSQELVIGLLDEFNSPVIMSIIKSLYTHSRVYICDRSINEV